MVGCTVVSKRLLLEKNHTIDPELYKNSKVSFIVGGRLFRTYDDAYALAKVNLSLGSRPARCPTISAAFQQSPAPVALLGSTLKAFI